MLTLDIYSYVYTEWYQIHQYFLQAKANAIQLLAQDHVQMAENCRILCAKFHVLFKNIHQKIATNFVSTLALSLALKNFICAKALQYSYSRGCSLANYNTKDHIIMLKLLIARSALTGYIPYLINGILNQTSKILQVSKTTL